MRNFLPGVLLLLIVAIAGCAQVDPRSIQIAIPHAAQSDRLGGDGSGGGGM